MNRVIHDLFLGFFPSSGINHGDARTNKMTMTTAKARLCSRDGN
jgi:hypothetical protein